jgi:hypothetical protein
MRTEPGANDARPRWLTGAPEPVRRLREARVPSPGGRERSSIAPGAGCPRASAGALRELSDHARVNELNLCACAEIIMANFGDVLKGGNIVGGLAIGVGFALLAPVVKPLLRPLAKSVLKAGIVAYDQGRIALAELNEQAGDVMAEARAEMEDHGAMDHDGGGKATHRRKLSEVAPKHAERPS